MIVIPCHSSNQFSEDDKFVLDNDMIPLAEEKKYNFNKITR